jgi:23S rRNA (cytidine2498-2'-O)-methyltransferase
LPFKLPPGHQLAEDFDPHCVFARTWGFALGKAPGATIGERACAVVAAARDKSFDVLHVWQRDTARPGFRGFEPRVTPAAIEAEAAIRAVWPGDAPASGPAQAGQRVLDCILIEPDQWWLGLHRAGSETCFPGGLRPIELPGQAVSRAYLKMEEALAWSGLPLQAGQHVAEIGCAPGGASQALLSHGLLVMGIDPAQVDPVVLADPHFTHVRKRGADVRRREFRGIDWLTADMNVAPQYTLDTVEAIVTHPEVKIRGLLVTLKLLDWDLAAEVPGYLQRIKSWGYRRVRARQLAHNRQEICVAADERRK